MKNKHHIDAIAVGCRDLILSLKHTSSKPPLYTPIIMEDKPMIIEIAEKPIEVNDQGFLCNLDDWSQEYAEKTAQHDGFKLDHEHWELIQYYRQYFQEKQHNPSMHQLVRSLGKMQGKHFREQKKYEKHIYQLFPRDPGHELCKLAGLPMPPPDT